MKCGNCYQDLTAGHVCTGLLLQLQSVDEWSSNGGNAELCRAAARRIEQLEQEREAIGAILSAQGCFCDVDIDMETMSEKRCTGCQVGAILAKGKT